MAKRGLEITLAHAQAHAAKHGYALDETVGNGKRASDISGRAGGAPSASDSGKKRQMAQKDRMTKVERDYSLILEAMKRRLEIVDWRFEGLTLRLADDCRYTPDFFIIETLNPIRIRFVETKGRHIWDDSKVKFRVAKEQNSWAKWEMHQKTKEGWKRIL